MFNDGSQNIEQMPGANGEQKPLDQVQQERATQWAESFPTEPNPWAQEVTETPATLESQTTPEDMPTEPTMEPSIDSPMEPQIADMPAELGMQGNPPAEDEGQLEGNPVQMSSDTTNQIRNTSNQVTAALEKSWNEGEGGPSLEDTYDSLRGKVGTEEVQQLVNKAEPTISHIQRDNANNASVGENTAIESELGDNTAPARAQIENDLHDLSVGAGTVAFGAQATAEQTINELEQSNDDTSLQDAQQELMAAQQQIETLTQETEAAAKAVENDQKLVHTAETMTSEAQDLVAQAQEDLQQAADEAEQRKDEIAEHQDQVDQLINTGAITEEKLNQDLSDGQSVDQIIQDNAPIANALGDSPNIQTSYDPLTLGQQPQTPEGQQLNPELTNPQEEEPEGPLLSIFG